jgi:hypothetical protein
MTFGGLGDNLAQGDQKPSELVKLLLTVAHFETAKLILQRRFG